MKVLIAVQGSEGDGYFRRTAQLIRLGEAEAVMVVHVIDETRRAEMEFGRERFLGHRELGSRRSVDVTEAEEERARDIAHWAEKTLVEVGAPETLLRAVTLRGRPREAVRDLAEREGIDLIVVGGRSGKPGPHSLGKTARFLLDHSPHAALLVRSD